MGSFIERSQQKAWETYGNIWKSMELLKNGGCNAKIWEIIEVGSSGDFSGMNCGGSQVGKVAEKDDALTTWTTQIEVTTSALRSPGMMVAVSGLPSQPEG